MQLHTIREAKLGCSTAVHTLNELVRLALQLAVQQTSQRARRASTSACESISDEPSVRTLSTAATFEPVASVEQPQIVASHRASTRQRRPNTSIRSPVTCPNLLAALSMIQIGLALLLFGARRAPWHRDDVPPLRSSSPKKPTKRKPKRARPESAAAGAHECGDDDARARRGDAQQRASLRNECARSPDDRTFLSLRAQNAEIVSLAGCNCETGTSNRSPNRNHFTLTMRLLRPVVCHPFGCVWLCQNFGS